MKAGEKKCPRCAEIIKAEALVCRHCGYEFSEQEMLAAKNAAMGKKLGCGCAVLVVGGILIWAASLPGTNGSAPVLNTGNSTAAANLKPGDKPSAPASKWQYTSSKDEMRGSTDQWATLDSENSVEMAFPYNGGVSAHINVRRRKQDGLQAFMTVDKGQIQCSEYQSSHRLRIKFDSGAIASYSCSNANDGDNSFAFIEGGAKAFEAKLKKSKKVMIEATMFDNGPQQWTFNTAGLTFK